MMADMDDLPDESIVRVVALLRGPDVCALGATCRRMHAISIDMSVWRVLFARDFARLYRDPRFHESHHYLGYGMEAWPPEARLLCDRTGAIERMPPVCDPVKGLPPPFARAFALGKDWLWLYRAHAVSAGRSHTGPGKKKSWWGRHTYVGDCEGGRESGYGALIGYGAVMWREQLSGPSGGVVWQVCRDSYSTKFETGRFLFEKSHGSDGMMGWWARSKGVFNDIKEWREATYIDVSANEHGRAIQPSRKHQRHGVTRTHFPNGDQQVIVYARGRRTEHAQFVCSPRCPDEFYAGRVLCCAWDAIPYDGMPADLLIPADSESPDGRLFWRYVISGLVGWDRRVRRDLLRGYGFDDPGP
jgi:hypothetical protein